MWICQLYILQKPRSGHEITEMIKILVDAKDKAYGGYRRTSNETHLQYYKHLRNYLPGATQN